MPNVRQLLLKLAEQALIIVIYRYCQRRGLLHDHIMHTFNYFVNNYLQLLIPALSLLMISTHWIPFIFAAGFLTCALPICWAIQKRKFNGNGEAE